MYHTISQKLYAISKYAPKCRYDHVVHILKQHTHTTSITICTFHLSLNFYKILRCDVCKLLANMYITMQDAVFLVSNSKLLHTAIKLSAQKFYRIQLSQDHKICIVFSDPKCGARSNCSMMSAWCLFEVCILHNACMMSIIHLTAHPLLTRTMEAEHIGCVNHVCPLSTLCALVNIPTCPNFSMGITPH